MQFKIDKNIPSPSQLDIAHNATRGRANRRWPWASMKKGDSVSLSHADWALGQPSMHVYCSRTGKKFEWLAKEFQVRIWCIEEGRRKEGQRIDWPFAVMAVGAQVRFEKELFQKARMACRNHAERKDKKFKWECGETTCTFTRIA